MSYFAMSFLLVEIVLTRSVDIYGFSDVCARQVGVRLEDQTARRREGVPHAGTFRPTICKIRCGRCSLHTGIVTSYNEFSVLVEADVEKRAPITVKFEIPYFTVSGIQVRYLKIVEKSGYQALPWVRYITQNGDDYRSVRYFSSTDCVLTIPTFTQSADGTRERQCPNCTDVVFVVSVDFCCGGSVALLFFCVVDVLSACLTYTFARRRVWLGFCVVFIVTS